MEFAASPPRRIFETANLLVSYGITSIEAFRTTVEIARRYLPEDLRGTEKLTFYSLPAFSSLLAKYPRTIKKFPKRICVLLRLTYLKLWRRTHRPLLLSFLSPWPGASQLGAEGDRYRSFERSPIQALPNPKAF